MKTDDRIPYATHAPVDQEGEVEPAAGFRLFIDVGEVGLERWLTAANGVRIGFSTLYA